MSHRILCCALFGILCALTIRPGHAQVYVAPQPGYPGPYQGYPNQGYPNQGYPNQGFPNSSGNYSPGYAPQSGALQGQPSAAPQPGNGQTQGRVLPPGIDHLYGMEGTNQILLYGTKQGYDLARQIIRGLDGDSNITATRVMQIRETPAYLASLGVTPGKDGALSPTDVQKLLKAHQDGKLTVNQTVRIESGDDEETDTVFGSGTSAVPFGLTTKIESGLQIRLTLSDPVTRTLTLRPGETTVVATPPSDSSTEPIVSLLFLTPTIMAQG